MPAAEGSGRAPPAQRLDLAAQRRERRPAQPPQDVRVAPLALGAAGTKLAADELLLALELSQLRVDVEAEPRRHLGSRERPAPAGPPLRRASAGIRHRLEEHAGSPDGGIDAERVAVTARILGCREPLLAGDANADRAPLRLEDRRRAPRRTRRSSRSPRRRSSRGAFRILGRGASDAPPRRAPPGRSARAAPPGRAARAAGRGRATAPAHAAPRAACRPRTCTSRCSRRGARTRRATPSRSRRRRGRARARAAGRAAASAPAGRTRPAGTRGTSRGRSGSSRTCARPASSPCAFSRCCQSGVRSPGRRRGMSSARAAFSRKRAPKSARRPTSASTRSSSSSGSSTSRSVGGGESASGRWKSDAVVRPDRLHLEAERLAQPRADGHRPRRVHAARRTA